MAEEFASLSSAGRERGRDKRAAHESGKDEKKTSKTSESRKGTNGETKRANEQRREEVQRRREIIDEALKKVREASHKKQEPRERAKSKSQDIANGEGAEAVITRELLYEEELPIGKDLKFKVSVHKRANGTYVMNKLPTNKYDKETIGRILSKSGIKDEIEFPKKWDKLSIDEKLDFLKSAGLDTLPDFLNFSPTDWGWRDPNRLPNQNYAYGHFVSEMEFRDLILEKWGNLGQQLNHQQQQRATQVETELLRRIQSNDPIWVLDAHLDVKEIREEIRNDPQRQAELDQVLTQQLQGDLTLAKNNLDAHYEQILQTAGENSLSDIISASNQEFSILQSNYRSIDESIRRIREIAASKRDIRGREGLRAWYAFKQIEMLQDSYFVYKRTELQVDPVENLRAAEEVMRFFEKSRNRETFDLARQRLVPMLQAVEKSGDPRVTVETKERFRQRFDSFEYMNLLLIAMDRSEGSPDQMHKIAVEFDNETWFYFYDRFVSSELKDKNGNNYLVDANGALLQLNLLSEQENAISYQYLVDRWRANRVQEMTQTDLWDPAFVNNPDAQWMIRVVLGQHNINLAQNFNFANLTGQQKNLIDGFWNGNTQDERAVKMGLVNRWFIERTWLGADGYEGGRPRKEIWLEMITQRHLRERLVTAGVAQDRIEALLGVLQNPNVPFDPTTNPIIEAGDYDLMSAVERNGYDLAKFKLADTLDGIRMYQQDGTYLGPLWGEDTPYFARAITDFAHWCKQEGQGDERVVKLLIEQLDKNWSGVDINPNWTHSGQILAQNATGARFFGMKDDVTRELVIVGDNSLLGTQVKNLITQEANNTGYEERDVEGYVWANRLREGIDPSNPNDVNLGLTLVNWGEVSRNVKSYPVHDMLFDRQSVWKWYLEKVRPWLNHPTDKEFFAMMQEYYSFRNVRRHPGMEFFLELQWRVGQHWKDWYGYEDNITIGDMEEFIQKAKELDLVDEKRANRLRNKLYGSPVIRGSKQVGELTGYSLRKTVASPGWWGGTAWDFLKTLFSFLSSGK